MTRYDQWRLRAPDDDFWEQMRQEQECTCRRPCPMSCRCWCHEQIEEE